MAKNIEHSVEESIQNTLTKLCAEVQDTPELTRTNYYTSSWPL
jgi:hypothetical protein